MKTIYLLLGIATLSLTACNNGTARSQVVDGFVAVDASANPDLTTEPGTDQDALMCGSSQHICSNACVSNTSVATCGTTSCTACPAGPTNGNASCNGTACGFTCNFGYVASGNTCVAAHLYVANSGTSQVLMCPFTSTGLGACVDSGNTFATSPISVTFNQTGTRAYVSGVGINSPVYVCPVNSNGTFGACVTTTQTFSYASVAINNAGTFAYLTNQSGNNVLLCAIATDGTFSSCVDSGFGTVSGSSPKAVALNASNTVAYIVLYSMNSVERCAVNATTGALSGCVGSGNTGTAISNPQFINLDASSTHAYVGNNDDGVLVCPINSDGSFGACANSGATGTAFNIPLAVLISGGSALVSNEGSNAILTCVVNSDGSFGACANSGASGLGFSNQSGIAIH